MSRSTRRALVALALLALAALASAPVALAAPGDLDPSFGTAGRTATERVVVARYTAPPPAAAAAPRGVKATRKGTTLVLRWRPGAGAVRQAVELRTSSGRRELRFAGAKTRTLRLALRPTETTATVLVRGVAAGGRQGPAARVSWRAAKR